MKLRFNTLLIYSFLLLTFLPLKLSAIPTELSFENGFIDDQLSNIQIQSIYQDKRDIIWIGTSGGLCRYNGIKVDNFRSNPNDPTAIKGDIVRAIYEDSRGNLWICTQINGGLNLFSRKKESFTKVTDSLVTDCSDVVEDGEGNLWIATNNGLRKRSPDGTMVSIRYSANHASGLSENMLRKLLVDSKNRLWIGARSHLDCMDLSTEKITHYKLDTVTPNDYEILGMIEDQQGRILISTYSQGVIMVDEANRATISAIVPGNKIARNVRCIRQDDEKNYWLITRNGLLIYNENFKLISQHQHSEYNINSISNNSLLSILFDKKSDVWIGSRGGLSKITAEKQVFHNYRAFENNSKFLNQSDIYAFWEDADSNLWVGTGLGGVNILNMRTQNFSYITNQGAKGSSLSTEGVKAFIPDNKGNLWIGTYNEGVNVLNLKTKQIKVYKNEPNENSLNDNRISAFTCDLDNNIWVSTSKGINMFDWETGKFVRHPEITTQIVEWIKVGPDNILWIGTKEKLLQYDIRQKQTKIFYNYHVRDMIWDKQGNIWLATIGKGVVKIDNSNQSITYLNESNGLSNDIVFSIIEDNDENLWFGTQTGLCCYSPKKQLFINLYKKHGLLSNQYNYGAAYKLRNGNLAFGGVYGFTIFNPKEVRTNSYIPKAFISNIFIFNKPVKIGEKHGIKNAISETDSLVLASDNNFITFAFTVTNYVNSFDNKIKYKLEGFDKDWTIASAQQFVSYTRLPPGEYVFRYYGANNDGLWSTHESKLYIRVMPPWTKSWWAIILFALIASALIYGFYQTRIRILKRNRKELAHLVAIRTNELEESNNQLIHQKSHIEEQAEELRSWAEHEKDANKMLEEKQNVILKQAEELIEKNKQLELVNKTKDRFFSIIAHDLRNPFHVVTGFSELILRDFAKMTPEKLQKYITSIHTASYEGNSLLENLLQWSRAQTGTISYKPEKIVIKPILNETITTLEGNFQKKNISWELIVDDDLEVMADSNMLKTILRNLLSNAIKFTPENGAVLLKAKVMGTSEVCFSVTDNGVGMDTIQQKTIFVPNENSSTRGTANEQGTGLGLVLCKEFVEKHGGRIWVESQLDKGSIFYFTLPKA